MEEKVIHGPEKMGPKITAVKAFEDWKLHLTFENGEERLFDMKPYRYGVFTRLDDPEYFARVRVSRGCLEWPHLEQALHYDMLYHESKALAVQ
jgi:hypothetical protein